MYIDCFSLLNSKKLQGTQIQNGHLKKDTIYNWGWQIQIILESRNVHQVPFDVWKSKIFVFRTLYYLALFWNHLPFSIFLLFFDFQQNFKKNPGKVLLLFVNIVIFIGDFRFSFSFNEVSLFCGTGEKLGGLCSKNVSHRQWALGSNDHDQKDNGNALENYWFVQ